MRKLFAALMSATLLASVAAMPASAQVTAPDANCCEVSENTKQYLDEFMELSLEELEDMYDNMYGDMNLGYASGYGAVLKYLFQHGNGIN